MVAFQGAMVAIQNAALANQIASEDFLHAYPVSSLQAPIHTRGGIKRLFYERRAEERTSFTD